MREDHYEENNTRNFIPTSDPGRHSSADRERTAPSAPPPLQRGEMAPGPARTGALPLAGGQHRDHAAPRGDPLRHRTVQYLPSGSRTVLRRSGRGRLPPGTPQKPRTPARTAAPPLYGRPAGRAPAWNCGSGTTGCSCSGTGPGQHISSFVPCLNLRQTPPSALRPQQPQRRASSPIPFHSAQ